MSRQVPQPGDPVAAVDTPALVIDLDAMERNLAAMARYAADRGMRLRPHAKTHKCAAIARRQIEAGAVGVCVQKLEEAQALAEAGVPDIFITNEIVDAGKLARAAALAGRIRLSIAVDSRLGIERLAAALQAAGTRAAVFVEVDIGHGRCGVAPAEAGALAHQVVSHGLDFAGLQAYHGSAQHLRPAVEREHALQQAIGRARAAQAAVTGAGIACPLVTGAGTGSFVHEAASGLYGELQPGSYLFMDRDYGEIEPAPQAPRFEPSLFVKAQVMSRGASHAVIDAGHKSHALDSGPPRVHGADWVWRNGGDEHGLLSLPPHSAPGMVLPDLGETVWLQPGHCDPTVNLHDRFVALRGGLAAGVVEAVWPIDARGALG